jgi:hypothetical protein
VDSFAAGWDGLWTTMTHQRNANQNELHLGRSNGAVGWLYYGIGGDTCVASSLDEIRAVFRQGFGVTHVEWGDFESMGRFDLVGAIVNGDTIGEVITDSELLAVDQGFGNSPKWTVYPNPANTELNLLGLDQDPQTLVLTDLAGKVLVNRSISDHTAKLDVSDLPAGMYLLTLQHEGARASRRITIAH